MYGEKHGQQGQNLSNSVILSYKDKSRKGESVYIHITAHIFVGVEMEVIRNKFVVTKRHIDGAPNEADFSVSEETLPLKLNSAQVADNAVMVKNLYMSIDPYQINRMKSHSVSQTIIPAAPPGQAIEANGVGKVVESAHPNFIAGDIVSGSLHWGQYSIVKGGDTLHKLDVSIEFPLSYYAGSVLGSSGLTAYVGFFHICKPKKGDKVFVSAAAGSVGLLVGQYAKLFGCYVVGCTGTKKKVDLLKEVGFDAAINYKEETNLTSALQRCFPEGIDIYFDNVGGEMLEAAIENMNAFGRVAACGVISEYTDRKNRAKPDMMAVVYKRIRIEGFLVVDFFHMYEEFISTTVQHLKTGKMKAIEDISYGVESIPTAFVDLFHGNNVGKKVVKIAQD